MIPRRLDHCITAGLTKVWKYGTQPDKVPHHKLVRNLSNCKTPSESLDEEDGEVTEGEVEREGEGEGGEDQHRRLLEVDQEDESELLSFPRRRLMEVEVPEEDEEVEMTYPRRRLQEVSEEERQRQEEERRQREQREREEQARFVLFKCYTKLWSTLNK